ncbi:c-type cytochrome [Runella sp. MFBS21]|uniref:c-type cytochrome n=1 Tax=Runella sp. MFBS21 TaxID=3034018 RepID=UPI0023F98854|nr:c-type cytochrome [Runella sp. MFBS21]MDF7819728.1 c-type cytochrome [Runella sp. MFBS21]
MKKRVFSTLTTLALSLSLAFGQESPSEEDFYKIVTPPVPEGVLLEVGGMVTLPDGRLAVATRRGDVWMLDNPSGPKPYFRKFASGLHEILGLAYQNGALICAQRGELTKLIDKDHDGKADTYETIYAWPLSAHYHEYSFGPKIAPDGSFFVSGNVAFGDEEWWAGESRRPLRGWIFKISPDGQMEPWATGVRSPCGLGMIDGELFYDDNQGDWIGSGGIWHAKKGAFMGHPAGLKWANTLPGSPLKITQDQVYATVDPRKTRDKNGNAIKPENVQNEKFLTLADMKKKYPETQLPAVWLPHGILGISNAEIIADQTNGNFGPFNGQLFVGDQGQSKVMRVFLEKVKGEYQGAAFDFRSGFQSGVLRMAWANDGGSLYIGETNRGWGSAGDANQGLQRLVWTGKTPFEMKAVRAMPDGFEVEFTLPVDKKSAQNLASYAVRSFTYKYHPVYGSPTVNEAKCAVKGVKVSEDGLKARIIVDNLRETYLHEIKLDGLRSAGLYWSLVHPTAYYTLNQIPDGEKLKLTEVSTKSTAVPTKTTETKTTAKATTSKVPTFEEVKPLLAKNTCLACHAVDKRQVGPAYTEVAKRKYSNEKIVELIYNPKPQNWPDYATPMAPMPQVPRDEALKIAAWINSLAPKSAPKP